MNFLAHMYLSCGEEDVLLGNFAADMLKNKEVNELQASVRAGVMLHRKIDSFTDSHPIFHEGVKRLRPRLRKYAPVALDVLYDYLLARHWKRYSGITLMDFNGQIYDVLSRRKADLPAHLHGLIDSMIRGNFLRQYSHMAGLINTFERMDARTRFPSRFVEAADVLEAHLTDFDAEFNHFFPELIAFVDAECAC